MIKTVLLFTVISSIEGYKNLGTYINEFDHIGLYETDDEVASLEDVKINKSGIFGFEKIGLDLHELSSDYVPVLFNELSGYREFTMRGCGNIDLDENSFKNAQFEKFEVSSSNYSIIRDYTFKPVWNLKNIRMMGNYIQIISNKAFASTNNLATIDLEFNKITKLTAGTFNCPKLNRLYLDENQIETIEDRTFQGSVKLQTLYLYDNQIKTIKKDTFYGLTSLKELKLNINKINSIEKGSFEHTPTLETLHLENNLLQSIDENMFLGCNTIEVLVIRNNSISSVSSKTFSKFENLENLKLQYNLCTDHLEADEGTNMLNHNFEKCHRNYEILSDSDEDMDD